MIKKIIALIAITLFAKAWNLYPTYPNYLKKRASLIKYFYFKAQTPQKIVALSFDDGPNKHTKEIMQVLNYYNAPATFFLIGKNIKKNSYKLYQNPLFSVGMHTFNHDNFDKISPKKIDQDFAKNIATFNKNHLNTSFFRPAYGVVNSSIVKNLKTHNIKAILWSNDTFDWDKKRRSFKRVVNNLKSGDIILMHDHATKPAELANLIEDIKAKGFKIVSLEELMRYKSTSPF